MHSKYRSTLFNSCWSSYIDMYTYDRGIPLPSHLQFHKVFTELFIKSRKNTSGHLHRNPACFDHSKNYEEEQLRPSMCIIIVRGPAIGPTLGTLSFHLATLFLHRGYTTHHILHSPSPFVVVRSPRTTAVLSRPFSYLTYVHLCIPAADLVPAADGLGFRVSSTAPS